VDCHLYGSNGYNGLLQGCNLNEAPSQDLDKALPLSVQMGFKRVLLLFFHGGTI
jgi:hypothetical protein